MASQSTSSGDFSTAQGEPPAAADDGFHVFLGIGILINVALVIAFGVWAWRQLRKSGRRDR